MVVMQLLLENMDKAYSCLLRSHCTHQISLPAETLLSIQNAAKKGETETKSGSNSYSLDVGVDVIIAEIVLSQQWIVQLYTATVNKANKNSIEYSRRLDSHQTSAVFITVQHHATYFIMSLGQMLTIKMTTFMYILSS